MTITSKQIPDEALKAMAKSMNCDWALQDAEDVAVLRLHIAAALNAWPGMVNNWMYKYPTIVLPLPPQKEEK